MRRSRPSRSRLRLGTSIAWTDSGPDRRLTRRSRSSGTLRRRRRQHMAVEYSRARLIRIIITPRTRSTRRSLHLMVLTRIHTEDPFLHFRRTLRAHRRIPLAYRNTVSVARPRLHLHPPTDTARSHRTRARNRRSGRAGSSGGLAGSESVSPRLDVMMIFICLSCHVSWSFCTFILYTIH